MLYFLFCVLFNHSMCVYVIISHSSPELLSPETETVEYTCNKKRLCFSDTGVWHYLSRLASEITAARSVVTSWLTPSYGPVDMGMCESG